MSAVFAGAAARKHSTPSALFLLLRRQFAAFISFSVISQPHRNFPMPFGQSRQKAEFEALALPYLDQLFSAAMRLTRSERDAEDLVQDTFLRACRAFGQFQRGSNVRAWLFRILNNTFINDYRHRRVEEKIIGEIPGASASRNDGTADDAPDIEDLADSRNTPEDDCMERLMADDILRAIDQLPLDFRMAVVLADLQEFSYREISEITGCPVGTVMSRLFRGRKLLRQALRQHAIDRGFLTAPAADENAANEAETDESSPVDLNEYRRKHQVR